MRRSYSFLSIILSIAILLGMQFFAADDVRADDLEFSNIQLNGSYLSWDPIREVDGYYDLNYYGYRGKWVASYSTRRPGLDLEKALDEREGITPGSYIVVLTAKDLNGNSYKWEGTYEYNKVLLNTVSGIVIDRKAGYMSWSHDTSNAKGAKITYRVDVDVDNSSKFYLYTDDKKIPLMDFAVSGTHKYHFYIVAMADGFHESEGYNDTKEITFTEGKVMTGLKIEDDVLSWDPVEGADSYRIDYFFGIENGGGHRSFSFTAATSLDLAGELSMYNAEDPSTITYIVSAYKGDKKITLGTPIEYEYENYSNDYYALSVFGTLLSPTNDIKDVLKGDSGSVTYYPKERRLVFKDFVLNSAPPTYKSLFQSYSGLTIEGNAVINIPNCAFETYLTSFTFAEGCDITIKSDANCIVGDYINVNGKLTLESKKGCTIYSDYDIRVKDNALLTASTEDPSQDIGAMYCVLGEIFLENTILISPEGGKLNEKGDLIVGPDGKFAKKIIIGNQKYAPTATPTATVKPTAKPTVQATAKPIAKPSAKPTSEITTAPDNDAKVQILDFVNRIYKYVLDREPEEEGAAFWSDELYSFRRTGAEVAQGFIFSPEFEARGTTDEKFVTILYKTFFGRDPEAEGLAFWLGELASGSKDRVTVANGFIYSQEWADTCASYGIRSGGDIRPSGTIQPTELTYAFVERMYTTAMGRSYDEEGRQYWASALANFEVTGESVGAFFFLSDEMTGYQLDDSEFLNRLYKTFMDREADKEGKAYWLGMLAGGTPRADVVFGFTRSPEFTDKCVEARILPY